MLPSVCIVEAEESPAVVRLVGLEHERPGAVAEDDGAVPVRGAPRVAFRRGRPVGVPEEDGPVGVGPRKEGGVAFAPTSRTRRYVPSG